MLLARRSVPRRAAAEPGPPRRGRHRELRGRIEQTLTQLGQRPVSAQPAYATPQPVTDPASAARLAVVAETDCQTSWRALLEQTSDRGLREAGLKALTDATGRGARWRKKVKPVRLVPGTW